MASLLCFVTMVASVYEEEERWEEGTPDFERPKDSVVDTRSNADLIDLVQRVSFCHSRTTAA